MMKFQIMQLDYVVRLSGLDIPIRELLLSKLSYLIVNSIPESNIVDYLIERNVINNEDEYHQLMLNLSKYVFYPNTFQILIAWASLDGDVISARDKLPNDKYEIPLYSDRIKELYKFKY